MACVKGVRLDVFDVREELDEPVDVKGFRCAHGSFRSRQAPWTNMEDYPAAREQIGAAGQSRGHYRVIRAGHQVVHRLFTGLPSAGHAARNGERPVLVDGAFVRAWKA